MQVGRLAAQEWAEAEQLEAWEFEHLLDPRTNTLAGTWYLAKLLRRYPNADRPEAFALADYNAGRANVLRWIDGEASTNAVQFLEGMDFGGTRAYVQAVLERWRHYRGPMSEEP
jgi:soluble lytic murein transglycosylase